MSDAPTEVEASDSSEEAVADAVSEPGPDADASCAVSSVADYCTGLPPLPAPPVIDGVLDCGPALLPMAPVFWSGPPPLPAFPAGNSTDLAAAWRPDGLYVFVAVTTPAAIPADQGAPIFYGAGVELFVDSDGVDMSPPAYDNPGAIQLIVTAPPNPMVAPDAMPTGVRAEGFRNAASQGPWASAQFGSFSTPTGFVFEGFIAASALGLAAWPLAAGQSIGFDVSVDVSFTTAAMTGPQGHREGQYFLHVAPAPVGDAAPIGTPFADPRSFCAPMLTSM